MLYFVHTIYNSNYGDLRDKVLIPHRKHFDDNLDKVLVAGNLSSDDGSEKIGGVAIFNMEDRTAVSAFMEQDPFMQSGLIASTTITRWNKVYFDFSKIV